MLNNCDVSSVQTSTLVPVHSLAVRALQGRARSSGCVIRFRNVCAEEEVAAAAGQYGRRAQPGLTYRMQYTNFHPILVGEGKGSSGLLGSEGGCLDGRVVIVGIVVISEQVSCVDEMVAEQQVNGLLCGDVPVCCGRPGDESSDRVFGACGRRSRPRRGGIRRKRFQARWHIR